MLKFFATCPKGLEGLLKAELEKLGASTVKETVAGVSFAGEMEIGLKACLWSRYAARILLSLASFKADSDIELYNGAYNIRYEAYFNHDATIAVSFNGQNDFVRNTQYGALRIKDAVCDRFVRIQGFRPNVDRENPDIRLNVHLDRHNNFTVSLDLSGAPLHQRDYRTTQGAAPLKENLAAAIVARSGYSGGNVIDPMCGSGTLIIEAALQACGAAPGLFRHRYGFYRLKAYDASLFAALKDSAQREFIAGRKRLKEAGVSFIGFDLDPDVVAKARDNIARADLSDLIKVETCDLHQLKNPLLGKTPGLIVCNPPYGERLGNFAELLEVYTTLGFKLRTEFASWRAGIISSDADLLSCLRLRYENKFRLYNGALECQLRTFRINDGAVIKGQDASSNQDAIALASREASCGKAAANQGESARDAESAMDGLDPVKTPAVTLEHVLKAAPDFSNRLIKNIKHLDRWAEREGLDCYRIYDADIPNYAAAIDRYGPYIVMQEYAAPKKIPAPVARQRMLDMIQAVLAVTGIDGEHLVLKVRERKRGSEQYERIDNQKHTLLVHEYGAAFTVNLWDYLDTGLFLDHRLIRRRIKEMARGTDFLNVFAYTGSATVQAALGGARSTTTVDMSRTYLSWAKDNLKANNLRLDHHEFIQADCLKWLSEATGSYDLIFADPPTFSNSKRMEDTFDVQSDHVSLITSLVKLLRPQGKLIFSNNLRTFKLDEEAITALGVEVKEITASTISEDFKKNKKIHNCWLITKA